MEVFSPKELQRALAGEWKRFGEVFVFFHSLV